MLNSSQDVDIGVAGKRCSDDFGSYSAVNATL
jgi:hypothetical protein